jgi:hypothetical protein
MVRSYHVTIDSPSSSSSSSSSSTMNPAASGGSRTTTKSTPTANPQTTTSAVTPVVFVAPSDAKRVKTKLESRGWLDKGFRMTKSTPIRTDADDNHPTIAIPVTLQGWEELLQATNDDGNDDDSWRIMGRGQEEMPFSTAKFAAKGKR